jgi:hypothetical protein
VGCHVVSFLHDVSQRQLLRGKDRRIQRASLSSHHLTRGDVKIMRSSVLCSFRRSKSNQLNERVHKVLALAMPGKTLDPKLAGERAFAISPHARSSDPAFMIPSAKGLVLLTHYVFAGG